MATAWQVRMWARRRNYFPDGRQSIRWRVFETAAANEIRNQIQLLPAPPKLHHWRSHGGAEVDIILEKDGIYYPMEVKLNSHPTRSDTSGITAFRKTYPSLKIGKGLVLCPAESAYPLSENDDALPWDAVAKS